MGRGETENARTPLCLITIVTGLLMLMSLLTGCGSGGETGSDPSASTAPVAATVSLEWQPVEDPSVIGYFVHYGRQSPGQPGSCTYERAMLVDFAWATVPNLVPNTTYY